jgi:Transcriptional regulators
LINYYSIVIIDSVISTIFTERTKMEKCGVQDTQNTSNIDQTNLIISFLSMIPKYNSYFYGLIDFKTFRITKTQLRALFVVHTYPGITMSELADEIATSREQATRAVSPLVRRKLLVRTTDRDNRRQLKIDLTEQGRELMVAIVNQFLDNAGKPFQSLTDRELEDFHKAIITISRTMNVIDPVK